MRLASSLFFGVVVLGAVRAREARAVEPVVVFTVQDPDATFERESLRSLSNDLMEAVREETETFEVVAEPSPGDLDAGEGTATSTEAAPPEVIACEDRACELHEARRLGASRFLSSRIVQYLDRCAFTVTLVDVLSGRNERGATGIGDCTGRGIFSSLWTSIESLSHQLDPD